MFKLKINLDRHNAGLKLNCWLLSDPPHFSLPSSFNACRGLKLYNEKRLSCSQCTKTKETHGSVVDPWHFCTDPDLDPQIRITDLRIRILLFRQWLIKCQQVFFSLIYFCFLPVPGVPNIFISFH
jgi:hypothetical protein